MITENLKFKCDKCGKFAKDPYVINYFGGFNDTEPPEPEHMCEHCYNSSKALIDKITWLPPYRLKEDK